MHSKSRTFCTFHPGNILIEIRTSKHIIHIQNVMNTEAVNVVDEANIPDEPVSPSIKKNGLIGAVAGAFIAIIVIIVVYLTNDTILTSEDVERYLGVSTLGIIPIREGQKKSKKKNKNGRGRKK